MKTVKFKTGGFLTNFHDDNFSGYFDEFASNVEPTKNTEVADMRVKHDVDTTKSVRCHKRKHSNAELVNEPKICKEGRWSIRSKSPDIAILKRAVERLKNLDDFIDCTSSDGTDKARVGIVYKKSEVLRDTETRQQTHRANLKETLTFPSRIGDQLHLQKIVSDILKGYKMMIIMRGPPGCGKSFLAREIIDATTNDSWSHHIFSASDYFDGNDGCFHFDRRIVGTSHKWNQARINCHVHSGWSPIIIDNTNIKKWEMTDYLEVAVQNGYLVEIVVPNTPWSKSADELVAMNIHDVPKGTIERMLLSYEPTTVNDLMIRNGLKYTVEMPQYRRLPTLS